MAGAGRPAGGGPEGVFGPERVSGEVPREATVVGEGSRDSTRALGCRIAGGRAAGDGVRIDELRLSEVVVVGTGVAGLAAALGCSPRSVTVLTKGRLGEGGSSAWAQGGVAAAVGSDDTPSLHAADTLAVSGGLGDPDVVALLTREAPVRIHDLIALGTRFDRAPQALASPEALPSGPPTRPEVPAFLPPLPTSPEEPVFPPPLPTSSEEPAKPASRRAGSGAATPAAASPSYPLALGREAAHSRRRILHAGGDATGAELVRALVAAVLRAPGVSVEEESFAVDLVVDPRGRRVVGVLALDPRGRRVLHLAGAVVLATGGLGQLFRHTTNPVEVTGDGLAMAARAGARLADLEMVQFHPTALAAGEADGALPLLTEALRGEGAVLVDGEGRRFMPEEHPDAELAPRDVVARAIHRRREAGIPVFLDAREAVGERFPERFPTVFAKALAAGLDPRREPLPVTAAAHYHMGGVETDHRGRTTLAGLWACGEAACTGAHGANRLASNSLLEALVFGARVAGDLAQRLAGLPGAAPEALSRLRVAGRAIQVAEGDGVSKGLPGGGRRRARRPWEGPGAGESPRRVLAAAEQGGAGAAEGAVPPGVAPGSARDRRSDAASRAGVGPAAPAETLAAVAGRLRDLRQRLRSRMWSRVGLLRDAAGLAAALEELDRWEAELEARFDAWEALARGAAWNARRAGGGSATGAPSGTLPLHVELHELRNLLTAGRLVATAALARPESRGAHQREDFPVEDPAWRRRLYLWLEAADAASRRPREGGAGIGGGGVAGSSPPILPGAGSPARLGIALGPPLDEASAAEPASRTAVEEGAAVAAATTSRGTGAGEPEERSGARGARHGAAPLRPAAISARGPVHGPGGPR